MSKTIIRENWEFSLYINNHIIVQRFFKVADYNKDVIKSADIKHVGDYCTEIITNDLKAKSVDYMWERFNPYIKQKKEDIQHRVRKNDVIDFEIKIKNRIVYKRRIDGSVYQPYVKYAMDIKPLIRGIIEEIQIVFSQDEFTDSIHNVKL
jgi:hypothetical protein